MTTARTADLRVWLGRLRSVVEITELLGGSVSGSASITTEAALGRVIEQASVHSKGVAFDLTSLYDGTETDGLISTILGTDYATGESDAPTLVIGEVGGALAHFTAHPVAFRRPGFEAPAADAITRPLSFGAQGRGYYGFRTRAGNAGTTASNLLASSVDRDGGTPNLTHLILILPRITTSVTRVRISDGSNNSDFTQAGLKVISLSTTDQAVTISTSGASGQPYVAFFGGRETVASG